MHGRDKGIARVEHQRDAHRLEAAAGQLRPVGAGRRRQGIAPHMREAHAGTLHHGAAFQDTGAATTAQALGGRLLPGIGRKRLAVDGGDSVGDTVLQTEQIGTDCLGIDHGMRAGGPER